MAISRRKERSMPLLLLTLLVFISSHAFILPPASQGRTAARASRRPGVRMQSVREQFWQEVDRTLRYSFTPSHIQRVMRFCAFCRQELPWTEAAPRLPYYLPSEEYIEGLDARPWWDTQEFPWVAELEDKSPIIREELEKVIQDGIQSDFRADSHVAQVMGTGWTALRLQRLGQWNDDVCALFPRTIGILAELDIPFAVRGVMFAKQAPQTGVAPHSDGRNFILTLHLGLKVPKEGCWISVAGERREWQEGKALILDTTYEHCTGNESEEDRYVLIIDFWHPGLTEAERDALRAIYDLRNEIENRNGGRAAAQPVPTAAPSAGVLDAFKGMWGGGGNRR